MPAETAPAAFRDSFFREICMSLKKQMNDGLLYVEFGHSADEDKEYEKIIERQRVHCKEMMFDYNSLRPSETKKKNAILKSLLADMGDGIWIESPLHMAYGCNTHMGSNVYANFNLTIVDDIDVYIGNNVMFGPNVTISVTGHPVHGELRRKGTQFSLPVRIGDDVWLGSNVVVLPGVTIGSNVVIGAGSVVTHDIPDNSLAYGVPCRVVREIGDYDLQYYRKGLKVNADFDK